MLISKFQLILKLLLLTGAIMIFFHLRCIRRALVSKYILSSKERINCTNPNSWYMVDRNHLNLLCRPLPALAIWLVPIYRYIMNKYYECEIIIY